MTTLRLYNTLSRSKEDFVPLDPTNVRMYVCGPTVYDFAHIGNARPAIVFDVLFRLLRHIYGADHVTYVRNITDIDDKINARALERRGTRNVPILDAVRELTQETYRVYQEDVAALGCLPPTAMPRATEYVPQMIAMTQALIDAGFAYPAEGHVLFDVEKKKDYGKLARRSTDDMIAGARVDVAPYKKNPMDFVLWKPSDDSTPGWDSPWGRGRPGWHLECSSMIEGTFGGTDTIDIHGGGIDLVFPHHENEIAQSEGAHHGHPLARYWMHNGFLNVEGEKMSKSLGNFVTIRDLLPANDKFGGRSWDGVTLRFAMLQSHYRQPIDWTVASLLQAETVLRRWKDVLDAAVVSQNESSSPPAKFMEALYDDLNAPRAIGEMHSLAEDAKRGDFGAAQGLYQAGKVLGLDWEEALSTKSASSVAHAAAELSDSDGSIRSSIEARNAARARKDFKESDRIRDELFAQGIVLKDTPQGTTWEVKR